jgi:hypothetical protein
MPPAHVLLSIMFYLTFPTLLICIQYYSIFTLFVKYIGSRTVKIFIPLIRPPSCMTSKAQQDAPTPNIGIISRNRMKADQFQ